MPRFSNWREDLVANESSNSMVLEVITDTKMTDTKDAKKVKEKKINNAKLIKINPTFKEAIEDIGGELLEVKEIDNKKEEDKEDEKEDSSTKQLKNKEKRVAMMKRQILMRKMMAVKQGAGADIVASYEPDGDNVEEEVGVSSSAAMAKARKEANLRRKEELAKKRKEKSEKQKAKERKGSISARKTLSSAQLRRYDTDGDGKIRVVNASYDPLESVVEYFYEEGINEEGFDQLIEEIGLEAFVDFVEGGAVELNEERAARKASVRAKKYDVVKKEVDKADAARKKAKKGEYAPSYAKKETDVTVYDDKPAAKKKAPAKKIVAKKAAPKPVAVKKTTTKKTTTKKVVKAVAKVKKTQPVKKPTKQGLGDKIRGAYKAGVKRHRKATQGARVFGKGFAAGAKKAVKFAKDVKKVVSEEELIEGIKGEDNETRKAAALERKSGVKTRLSPSKGKNNAAKMARDIKFYAKMLNKEGYEEKKTSEVLAAFKRDPKVRKRFEKSAKKEDGPGSVKNRAADSMLQTAKDTAKRKGDTSKSDDRYAYEENALEKRAKENEKARKWLKKDAKDSGYTDIALKASMSKGAGVSEGIGDAVKKGVKRHKDAVEKKKIKNRKAVPYAALAAEHQPEGEVLDERLGGKGYKSYTSLTGKKISGDWEDSDRGAGNKAKKRAGGKVGKKSPTYLAHVHNKEEVQVDEAKVDQGRSDYGKASIRNYRRKGPGHGEPAMFDPENKRGKLIDKRREEHKARRGVKGAKVPAYKVEELEIDEGKKKGLWDNIYAKRKRGEKPAKPGDKDYPETLNVESLKQARKNVGADKCWDGYKAKGTKKKGGKVVPNCVKETTSDWRSEVEEGAAWTKKSGKSPSGGLNEKGRKSYERENPGSDLKAPQPEGGSRKKSFCARMGGMKKKLTSSKTANDPDSRINKSLRKWKCNEEGYDRMRDDRLVKYGIGHDGSDRKGPSPRPTGKRPKGDTNYQKEMKKKYGGKLPSAIQVVKDKYKGQIYDGKKKG